MIRQRSAQFRLFAEDICSENNSNPFGIDYGTPTADKPDFRLVSYSRTDVVADYDRLRGYPIPDHLHEETVRVRHMQPGAVPAVDGRRAPCL